ncbi:MAG: transposase [Candidatus Hadarchaeota archaeon]
MYLNLDFLESWAEDVGGLNEGKVGAPFEYPESLMTFLGFVHVMLSVDYRGLEGLVRGLCRFVSIEVPDYSTICRRVNALKLQITETLLDHGGRKWWCPSTAPG